MATHAEKARDNFLAGYNCAQAVACAFAGEMGLPVDQVARLASGFGGGFGRMREVCGAVSGAVLVYNWLHGYCDPEDAAAKSQHYGRVMRFCFAFQEKCSTGSCTTGRITFPPHRSPARTIGAGRTASRQLHLRRQREGVLAAAIR